MRHIKTLTAYKAWADELFFAAVATVPEHELSAPRPIYFGSLIRTLHHSYAMDKVWQAHLLGKPHTYTTRNPAEHPAFHELRGLQKNINAWYVDYAQSLSDEDLAREVHFTFIGGGSGMMTCNDILLHVVNHTTYHRGHVADMLYTLSIFPPTTDLPVFLQQQQIAP
jgi:uncharacterized damage-inducible protein DinB